MWRSAARRSSLFRRLLSSSAAPAAVPKAYIVHKRGNDILNDPWYNKDTAFPMTERDRLGLRGLLPAAGHDLRGAVRAVHKLVPHAGEQHADAGRAGVKSCAGQVEGPQQATLPQRDTVLQGAN
ncbi:unnamed protein product [Urochloa humidicola]